MWFYNRPPNAQFSYRNDVPSFGGTYTGFQDLLVARAAGDLIQG